MTPVWHNLSIFSQMKLETRKRMGSDRPKGFDSSFCRSADPADSFADYIALVRQLRSQCPWDREQTHATLSHLLIEEAYEAVQAIERDDLKELKLELGDLLLLVVFHSIIAEETAEFDVKDVIESSVAKLVCRHPHVFGNVVTESAEEVLHNWESIKKSEESNSSLLDGVPDTLPALLAAYRMQEKVANIGFDFASAADSAKKVDEEIAEFREAKSEEEFGDLLFALVNYGRHMGLKPDRALRQSCARFRARFQYLESKVDVLRRPSMDKMDFYWEEAKCRERVLVVDHD